MKHLLLTTIAAVLVVGCGPPSNPKADRALLDAAKKGNIEAVKQAIDDGADLNTKGRYGATPLQDAAFRGHQEIVELLIVEGANVKSENGVTPLHTAALNGHKEVVELLIAAGADVNAKDGIGGKTTARKGGIKDQYLV